MSQRKFTDSQAIPVIRDKTLRSIAQVLRKLKHGETSGGGYALIKRIAQKHNIDTSHWLGFRHMLGKRAPNRKPVQDLLVVNGPKINSHDLKLRLLRDGVKEHRCERCKLTHWLCTPIPLDLHHVNGNRRDNRLENIKLLCPNCHALTPNYCGKAIPLRRAVAQLEGGISLKN